MRPDYADRVTRATYEASAEAYAARSGTVFEKPFVEEHLALFGEACPPPARVLALGTGTGEEIEKLEAAGYEVVGLDLARAMLEEARGPTDAPLVQADMRELPFGADSFDAVWASMSLLHLTRDALPGVLSDLRTLVREGGSLYATLKAGEGEALVPWQDGQRFFTYYEGDELSDRLREAGFDPGHQHVEPSETRAGQDILVQVSRARGPRRERRGRS